MITLDNIRKDLGELLETEKNLKHVEVHADTLDEALADAAVQLNTKVVNLEYEVKEKGYEGFFGIAKKPWTILVYQNPEVAAKIAKEKELHMFGSDVLQDEEINNNKDGEYFIRHFGSEIFLKITLPVGEGQPVNYGNIITELERPDTKDLDENLVKKLAKEGTKNEYVKIGTYTRSPANDAIFVVDITKDELKATCTINPPSLGGADITVEQIVTALKGQGVVAGISEDKIQELVDRPVYNAPVLIAEAVLPVDGRDA